MDRRGEGCEHGQEGRGVWAGGEGCVAGSMERERKGGENRANQDVRTTATYEGVCERWSVRNQSVPVRAVCVVCGGRKPGTLVSKEKGAFVGNLSGNVHINQNMSKWVQNRVEPLTKV